MATMIDLQRRIDALPNPYWALAMKDIGKALRDLVHLPKQRARICDDLERAIETYEQDATEWLMEVAQ